MKIINFKLTVLTICLCVSCTDKPTVAEIPKEIKTLVKDNSVAPNVPITSNLPNPSLKSNPSLSNSNPTDQKNNKETLKNVAIASGTVLTLGALYLAHKKLTQKAEKDIQDIYDRLGANRPEPLKPKTQQQIQDEIKRTQKIRNDLDRSDQELRESTQRLANDLEINNQDRTVPQQIIEAFGLKSTGDVNSIDQLRSSLRILDLYQRFGLTIGADGYYRYATNINTELKPIVKKFKDDIKESIQRHEDLVKKLSDLPKTQETYRGNIQAKKAQLELMKYLD